MTAYRPALLAALAALSLGACAATPGGPEPLGLAESGLAARDAKAAAFLSAGDPERARAELRAQLAAHPRDKVARKLIAQIEAEPEVLLGARKYPYRTRPGETLASLSERFLGDRLMFYALARYNGIARPGELPNGRVLLIPTRTPAEVATALANLPAPAKAPPAVRDASRAHELRVAALDYLSGGSVDRAVSLLQQAHALSPGDAAIRGDLERATRIRATVRRSS